MAAWVISCISFSPPAGIIKMMLRYMIICECVSVYVCVSVSVQRCVSIYEYLGHSNTGM